MKKAHVLTCFLFLIIFLLHQSQPIAAGYHWKSVKIAGGGFVISIITCVLGKNLINAYTNEAVTYRWIETFKSWKPFPDLTSMAEWTFRNMIYLQIQ